MYIPKVVQIKDQYYIGIELKGFMPEVLNLVYGIGANSRGYKFGPIDFEMTQDGYIVYWLNAKVHKDWKFSRENF